jgi:hypothetical protein
MSRLFRLFLFYFTALLTTCCFTNHTQKFYSQASQDEFAYTLLYDLLHKQDEGYYLEIGSSDPIKNNNTYFFEKNLNWKGVGLDIDDKLQHLWSATRKNPLLIQDATKADYRTILRTFPHVIDYLSLDIDGKYDEVLRQIPFDDYVFKFMTIEHDCCCFGDKYKISERQILTSLGYYLLCADVSFRNNSFEDWWIHPSILPADLLSSLKSLDLKNKEHGQLLKAIQSLIIK